MSRLYLSDANAKPLPLSAAHLKRHLPVLCQLAQHLGHERLYSHLPHLIVQLVAVHGRDELLDSDAGLPPARTHRRADTRQGLKDLSLTACLACEFGVDLGRQIWNHDTVCWVADLAVMCLH